MIIYYVIIFLTLLSLSFIFSGTEVAFSSVSMLHLERLAEKDGAKFLDRLNYKVAKNFPSYLSVMLFGNNMVNISIASIATVLAHKLLGSKLSAVGSLISTVLVIIFGEILPKTYARVKSQSFSKAFCLPLYILSIILFPVTAPFNFIMKKIKESSESLKNEEDLDSQEIQIAVEVIKEGGEIDQDEKELLCNTIDFNETYIYQVATARVDIEGIDIEDDIEDIRKIALATLFSRLVIYEGSKDEIKGIILTCNLIRIFIDNRDLDKEKLISLIFQKSYKALFVHMTMSLSQAIHIMRKERKHLVIINDEFQGTYGLATMEDIMEELSGDIFDESDKLDIPEAFWQEGDLIVKGSMNISDIVDYFDIAWTKDLEEKMDDFESNSIGGLAWELLDRKPNEEDEFEFLCFKAKILEMKKRRVKSLKITKEKNSDKNEK